MDNQPSFHRDLIIPIVIGGISVIGLIVALLIGRSLNSPPEVPMTPSLTPFEFIFLGTEPAITTPLVEGSEIAALPEDPFGPTLVSISPTSPSAPTANILPQPNRTNTTTAIVLLTNTPTSNSGGLPTATVGTASAFDTYDDTDPRLAYVGGWVSQTNVSGAYQGTLHVSTGPPGNSVTFTFTGEEFHFFYQVGPSLGTLAITIDGELQPLLDLTEDETQIHESVYELESAGTHAVVIEHYVGGAVNIDSIVVPRPIPTPTRTVTPTQ